MRIADGNETRQTSFFCLPEKPLGLDSAAIVQSRTYVGSNSRSLTFTCVLLNFPHSAVGCKFLSVIRKLGKTGAKYTSVQKNNIVFIDYAE